VIMKGSRAWVGLAALATALALAGCTGSGRSPGAPSSTHRAAHLSFHEPTSPADAASEFVRAMAVNQADVTDRLMCLDRPNVGSWPLSFASPDSDTTLHFDVGRARRTKRAAWRVRVDVRVGHNSNGFHVDTTVVRTAEHYRVCSAESR
jgi:hypothetical protein